MDVFPARNLGAGEPWGRKVEDELQTMRTQLSGIGQEAGNNGRTTTASLELLTDQLRKTNELVTQMRHTIIRLDEAVERLPEHALSLGESSNFSTPQGTWVVPVATTMAVPPERKYAVLEFEGVVQMQAQPVAGENDVVWVRVVLKCKGEAFFGPTTIGVPMNMVLLDSGLLKTLTINHTFFLDDVAGEVVTAELAIYAGGAVSHTNKNARLSVNGQFLRDTPALLYNESTNPVEPPPEPNPGGSNSWKWPMNPSAINSRHSGGVSGGYENPVRPDHNGLDFSWRPWFQPGMAIRAAADGVVHKAYYEPGGGGWAVEIKHSDRWYTGYYHAVPGSIRVAAGQTVTQGQHLMNAGESGQATGPHLHFMVVDMNKTGRYWSSHIDPEVFMSQYNPNDEYV